MADQEKEIGGIGNYYGGLRIKAENGKFFWGIEDWNGTYWEEIPESLYTTLNDFEQSRLSPTSAARA